MTTDEFGIFCVLHNHADFTIFACLTSSHDRGFFPGNSTSLDELLTVLTTLEALMGLVIEVTFMATLTQRFFNR